jgi:MOSC domain-containing protein YiiM
MNVISVNVRLPRTVQWKGKPVSTGIFKTPVSGRVQSSSSSRVIALDVSRGRMACKLTAAFEGSRLTSDAGVMFFAGAETDGMRHRRCHDGRDRFD